MKKKIILLSIMLLLVSGCSVHTLSTTDISHNVDLILSEDSKLTNVNFDGYEYYVPFGMTFVDKNEYNALLQDQNFNEYYLYVDVISYLHKTKNTYKEDKDAYYSEKLNYNKKTGYLEINKEDDLYFVEFVFNYAKIEAYVSSFDLVDAVNNMCYILQSVSFHREVLESLVGDNVLSYKSESFNIFESQTETNQDVLEFDDYVDADVKSGEGSTVEDNFEINEMD